jgi:hypothetical protein
MTLTQKVSTKSALLSAKPERSNAVSKAYQGSDDAIALSCMAGSGGIKSALINAKVVHGMAFFILC